MVVGRPLEHDRAEQLARHRARELVGPEFVDHPELLVRDEQEEPQQLRFDRRDRTQDVVDRERIWRRQHRIGGDPGRSGLADRIARRPLEDLTQDAILDTRGQANLADGLVAPEREYGRSLASGADAAPVAALVSTLGPPTARSAPPSRGSGDALPLWLLALISAALLAETASRRVRGAR